MYCYHRRIVFTKSLTTSNEIIVKINPAIATGINIQTENVAVCANTLVEFTAPAVTKAQIQLIPGNEME